MAKCDLSEVGVLGGKQTVFDANAKFKRVKQTQR